MHYWLFKSEPECFSIDHLQSRPKQVSHWDGVRNYQARNMLRDEIKAGDLAFFYHSSCEIPGIVGIMKVVRDGYPDFTAWDPEGEHYDPQSTKANPRWYMVDVQFIEKFPHIISLSAIKSQPALHDMIILRKGNRLSITPVTKKEWEVIVRMGSPATSAG
jgi:predicted RNA-binding protein with PUA-like domain